MKSIKNVTVVKRNFYNTAVFGKDGNYICDYGECITVGIKKGNSTKMKSFYGKDRVDQVKNFLANNQLECGGSK